MRLTGAPSSVTSSRIARRSACCSGASPRRVATSPSTWLLAACSKASFGSVPSLANDASSTSELAVSISRREVGLLAASLGLLAAYPVRPVWAAEAVDASSAGAAISFTNSLRLEDATNVAAECIAALQDCYQKLTVLDECLAEDPLGECLSDDEAEALAITLVSKSKRLIAVLPIIAAEIATANAPSRRAAAAAGKGGLRAAFRSGAAADPAPPAAAAAADADSAWLERVERLTTEAVTSLEMLRRRATKVARIVEATDSQFDPAAPVGLEPMEPLRPQAVLAGERRTLEDLSAEALQGVAALLAAGRSDAAAAATAATRAA
ncbi:hypothetical protein HYH03_013479 [Edaphochlamys debaryana]|uniref:Uncharacterized protein n=1 Tax=Edaphochlamys debaryana TaxID=47281 RepID=A0A835XS11_9CHLO|nr:hypothetical protein HYH03_013479 [Edaphochlamys debaryana]|eukprot:KAG2487898.1 hypothetical protein HYH03_013479 [Edaphochlamys debaryana]